MVTAHAVDPAKETKLKRAVAFFKTLGHKKHGRSRASSELAVNAYADHLDSNSYSRNRTYELGDTSPRPVELDSGKIHELGHDVQCVTPTSPTASTMHYTPSTSSPQFWGDNYQDWRQPYSPPTVPSESLAADEDVHLEARRRSIAMPNSGNHALTVPASLTGSSPAPYELPASERFTSSTPSLPPPVHELEDYPSKQKPSTTQIQVSEFSGAVRAMSEEWIRRLAKSINITRPCSDSYTSALVENGFRVLRDHFRGSVPSSFQDVFAFIHVAGASAYISHRDDPSYSWDAFLMEAYQWQDLLSNDIEKATLVKSISRLCHPQEVSATSQLLSGSCDDIFLPTESAVLLKMLSNIPSSSGYAALQEKERDGLAPLTEDSAQTIRHRRMRGSLAIKACTNILDTLEYTLFLEDIADRRAAGSWYTAQHISNVSTMECKTGDIVSGLQRYVVQEGLGGYTVDSKVDVRGGLQRNVRELEMTLTSTVRSFFKPGQVLARCVNFVKFLCDKAMQDWGENWRDGFYTTDSNTALKIFFQVKDHPRYSALSPPFSPCSTHNSDTSIMVPMSATASRAVANNTHSESAHTLLQSGLNSTEDVSYCPHEPCRMQFTGSCQKQNLNRHLRTALHHTQDDAPRPECELCHQRFSRVDGLQSHQRKIHKIDPPMQRQTACSRRESRDTTD